MSLVEHRENILRIIDKLTFNEVTDNRYDSLRQEVKEIFKDIETDIEKLKGELGYYKTVNRELIETKRSLVEGIEKTYQEKANLFFENQELKAALNSGNETRKQL